MKNKFLLFLTFIFIMQCGYKVVNHNELNQFNIVSFELEGENRVNRILKKNVLFYSKDTSENIFNIKLQTKKNKKIVRRTIQSNNSYLKNDVNKRKELVTDVCSVIKKCNIIEISNYLIKEGKNKNFPNINIRQ